MPQKSCVVCLAHMEQAGELVSLTGQIFTVPKNQQKLLNRNDTHRCANVDEVGRELMRPHVDKELQTTRGAESWTNKQSSSRSHQLIIQYGIVSHDSIHILNVIGTVDLQGGCNRR